MDQIKNILAAVDFSPCAEAALKQALRLGRVSGAQVTVLHAVQPLLVNRSWLDERTQALVPTLSQQIEQAESRLRNLVAAHAEGVGVHLEVAGGHAMATILDYCTRLRPDLLVLGAHSSTDAHRHMGYIASGAIRKAAAPVLAVHLESQGPFARIVVATDFSGPARRAFGSALRLAALDRSRVEVLHVYPAPWSGEAPPDAVRAAMPDFSDLYAGRVRETMEEWSAADGADRTGLEIGFTAVQHAKPVAAIVERTLATSADLIVMGVKGATNLRYLLLGSTAEGVLRRVPCSVLAVKPEED